MTMMTRTRPAVNPKPAPVRKTTILFDATERHPARRTFGQGVLPSYPSFRSPVPFADLEWAATALNDTATALDRHVDQLALASGWDEQADVYEQMEPTPTPASKPINATFVRNARAFLAMIAS